MEISNLVKMMDAKVSSHVCQWMLSMISCKESLTQTLHLWSRLSRSCMRTNKRPTSSSPTCKLNIPCKTMQHKSAPPTIAAASTNGASPNVVDSTQGFVTMVDLNAFLNREHSRQGPITFQFVHDPPNPKEGSAVEHINKLLDAMEVHVGDKDLCLREFSKSLSDKAYMCEERITILDLHNTCQCTDEDLMVYVKRLRDLALDCYSGHAESFWTAIFVKNMSIGKSMAKLAERKAIVHTLSVSIYNKWIIDDAILLPQSLRNPVMMTSAIPKAILSIVDEARGECINVEAHANRAYLESFNAITFTDEDMEAPYPDHRKPLYLSTQINFIGIIRALVDTGSSLNLIPLSTIIVVGIPQIRIVRSPLNIIGFGSGSEHALGYIQLKLKIKCNVDFRNLNKAYPKDEFSIPNMDVLMDNTASGKMYSLMDGNSGYNQVKEQQRAFLHLQDLMLKLTTILVPIQGRPLKVYLSTLDKAMGGLVAQDDKEGKEQSIYYVSQNLKGVESINLLVEKICLALIYSSLNWLLKLSQYDITCVNPIAIKGQAVVDLLFEFSSKVQYPFSDEVPGGKIAAVQEIEEEWILHFDGFSMVERARASIVLRDGEKP
ncbi:hypothetical protein SLEP1_g27601 [Rubroshorea leprosula]|uniref:Reverse transcriptase/retrotransposon-derived protein RNase H-like domain-containing protein n=1 Tax=Rubroshorea leprosula TaxID=152421 RepID=A0AAV5JQX8_9ROSI|nr:hypothetical protein SLEP1_g27601 [Rubroshorea leprosula]